MCVAGYSKEHYFFGTPELKEIRRNEDDKSLYKRKKKWVTTIRPKKKKGIQIIKGFI